MMALMMRLMYPCDKIREFVFDYAEGKLDPIVSMRFRLHISKCKDCQEYVKIYKLASGLGKLRLRNPPPRELVDKTREFLERQGLADFSED